jgi:hypothetical protein
MDAFRFSLVLLMALARAVLAARVSATPAPAVLADAVWVAYRCTPPEPLPEGHGVFRRK